MQRTGAANKLIVAALLIAGLFNFAPIVGVLSVEQLERLYEVPLSNDDLIILMRHRAVLFGMLGAFIIYSAFRESLQILACVAGLVSMVSFIILAYASGEFGPALNKVIIADVIGSLALVLVLFIRFRSAPSRGSRQSE